MDSDECVERIRLIDVYGQLLADFNSRLDALKRPTDNDAQYKADLSAAESALEASQQAWADLARHIADHQCVDLSWPKSDPGDSQILGEAAAAALDIILVADDNRRFVDVNEAATRLLGLSREEIIGRRIDEFFSLDGGNTVPSAWDSFVAEGIQCGTCELRTSGSQRIFEYRAKANFAPGFHVSVLRERP